MSHKNQRSGKYVIIFLMAGAGQITTISEVLAEKANVPSTNKAMSIIHPTTNNSASGSVMFKKTSTGVTITAKLTGLTEGTHGFHIHEIGDCSSGDGKSAGGHFNPFQVNHAAPDAEVRHIGDLGNIVADSKGKAIYERIDKTITLEGQNSIIGKGIIIHAGEDDLTTQPTGAAGARIGCGVIQ